MNGYKVHVAAAATESDRYNDNVDNDASAHVDGHVDAEVAAVGKQLCNVGVEYETVTGVDRRLDAVVYTARRRFPRQPPLAAVQLQPVHHKPTACQPKTQQLTRRNNA